MLISVKYAKTGEEIPVGSIFCLGQNYPLHAQEMSSEVPTSPVIFTKPATAILRDGAPIVIPPASKQVHHEVELVVLLGSGGRNIPPGDAFRHVLGYGVGLDMTLRDLQSQAKAKGQPWAVAKGFDTSAPVSDFLPAAAVGDPCAQILTCSVNGIQRQHAPTRDMVFTVDRVISWLSAFFTLRRGDLIFTGTPPGVGEVHGGDVIVAELSGLLRITHPVTTA
jgi:acylpyruvate hydrolase